MSIDKVPEKIPFINDEKPQLTENCRFCGESDTGSLVDSEGNHFIYCIDCNAAGPYGKNREEAIEKWNNK